MHPPSSGKRPIGWRVVSNAKTTEASSAREAPAKSGGHADERRDADVDPDGRERPGGERAERGARGRRRS